MAKKKRYTGQIDFKSKTTARQVVLLWNKLSMTQKRELSTNQLQAVIDIARSNNRSDIYEQVYPIFNRKRTSYITDTQEKRIATRKLNTLSKLELGEIQETQAMIKKINRIQKATGVIVAGNQTTRLGIPSAEIFKQSKEEYVNQRLQANLEATEDKQVNPKYLRKKAEKEYDEAMRIAKTINLREINKESLNFASNFIDNYFKSGDEKNNAIIKEYLKGMTVQQRYALLQVLTSEKFLKLYDSDEDNVGYDPSLSPGERAKLRQEHIIKILKNETNKQIIFRKGIAHEKKIKRKVNLEDTFQNWI